MKQLFTQYSGLKRELYILFIGKLVTAMGSFVWPMLTFFLTTKLGLSDGVSTLLIATSSILSFPAALLGGKLADRFPRKSIIILFDCLTIFISTVLIFFFIHAKNAVTEDAAAMAEQYSEYEQPVEETLPVLTVLRQRPVLIGMLLIGCFASMPSNLVGILLPLQLKDVLGAAGATIYGYLNSLNGFVVILFTPVLTIALKKYTEIPKAILGMLLFTAGIALFSVENAVAVLFVGMFVFTLGEVVTVLGSNPYTSRRIPASHRGRVGGISSVVYSIFSSLTQYLISFMLILSQSNYTLLWMIFVGLGLASALLYGLMYGPDKRTFPKLYENTRG